MVPFGGNLSRRAVGYGGTTPGGKRGRGKSGSVDEEWTRAADKVR